MLLHDGHQLVMIQGTADVSGRPQRVHVFGCQQRIDDRFLH